MSAPLGSLLIGSTQVDAMKLWYRRGFDLLQNDMGAFDLGGIQLFIEEHSEVRGPAIEPARMIINLNVDDCRRLAEHLPDIGTPFMRGLDQEPFGLVATVADPDGNYLQIIEWGQPRRHIVSVDLDTPALRPSAKVVER